LIVAKTRPEGSRILVYYPMILIYSAKKFAQAYRRRWDMRYFFRFIKQELNGSHLVSPEQNGIEVDVIY